MQATDLMVPNAMRPTPWLAWLKGRAKRDYDIGAMTCSRIGGDMPWKTSRRIMDALNRRKYSKADAKALTIVVAKLATQWRGLRRDGVLSLAKKRSSVNDAEGWNFKSPCTWAHTVKDDYVVCTNMDADDCSTCPYDEEDQHTCTFFERH